MEQDKLQQNKEEIVFDKFWFQKHQKKILWLANSWIGKYIFRFKKMGTYGQGIDPKKKFSKITPFSVAQNRGKLYFKKSELLKTAFNNPENSRTERRVAKKIYLKIQKGIIKDTEHLLPATTEQFFSRNEYARKLYFYLYPLWLAMHIWDWFVADHFQLAPKLSFGFATLTQYPGSIGADNPCDGNIVAYNATYSTCRNASSGTASNAYVWTANDNNSGYYIRRAIVLFDTSALGAGVIISATTLSLYGQGPYNQADAGQSTVHIVSSNPAATNVVSGSDYASAVYGTTSYANLTFANRKTADYNVFTLSADGIDNVSKTGISKFGVRLSGDIDNTAPVFGENRQAFASVAIGSSSPKLIVTYTTVVGPANLKSYNTNLSANIKSINTNLIANVKSLDTNV